MIWGLDVSHWQTKPAAVPWKGRAFGCVRITWGVEGVDELADEHMARALDAGVQLLIAYHYQKDQPGSIQADHFHRRRRELEATFGPLGCANDLEDMIGPDGKPVPWDLARYQASTAAFVGRHRELTPRPLAIYGNPHDLQRYAVADRIADEPLWLADWLAPYPVPPPWKRWTILQFKGGGLTGFDENRYDGTIEEMRARFLPDAVHPLTYDSLGPVTTAVRAAEGRGATVETFVSRDEGPVIDGR